METQLPGVISGLGFNSSNNKNVLFDKFKRNKNI